MKTITYKELTPELAAAGCLVTDMPNDAYHAYPAWNNSSLTLIARSPAHYQFRAHREATRAMEIGTAVHAAILEPDRFKADYMLLETVTDRRSSAYKEAVKAYAADRVMTGPESAMIIGIQETVRHPLLAATGHVEAVIFATCDVTGLLLKSRFDKLFTETDQALDLKTTVDARPNEFAKSVDNYRYHVQDAFYRHVYRCATSRELSEFVFLAIEKDPPYFNHPYTLDAEALEIGNFLATQALKTAAHCEKTNDWPMPEVITSELSLPSWAIYAYETELERSIT